MSPTTRRALAIALAAAVVLTASTAFAAKRKPAAVKPVSSQGSVPTMGDGSVQAKCGKGRRVAMAGFDSTLNPDTGQLVAVTRMAPTARAVQVGALNLGQAGTVTATAYCTKIGLKKKRKKKAGKAKKKVKTPVQARATTPIAASDPEGTATATCPAGTRVRAAGFETTSSYANSSLVVPQSLELASPNQVRFRAINTSMAQNSITAIALCGKGPPLIAVESTIALPLASGTIAVAICPAGRRVAFAGFRSTGDAGETLPAAIVRASDSQAQVKGYSIDNGNGMTAIAYCEKLK